MALPVHRLRDMACVRDHARPETAFVLILGLCFALIAVGLAVEALHS
ncbi:MAG: hypothetical protein WB998_10495 [Solirubrobacteraceae bacterium]